MPQDPKKLLEGRLYLHNKRLEKRIGAVYGRWKVLECLEPPGEGTKAVWLIECNCGRFSRRYHRRLQQLKERQPCPRCIAEESVGKIVADRWVILGPAPRNVIRLDMDVAALARCIKCGRDQVESVRNLVSAYPWKPLDSEFLPVCSKCGGKGLPRPKLKKRAVGFFGSR